MRNIFKKCLFVSVAILSLTGTGCKKYLDVNTDPRYLPNADYRLYLPAAEEEIANRLGGTYSILGGLWAQHWAQANGSSQYADEDQYVFTEADYNTSWEELYAGALNDLATMKRKAAAAGDWNAYLSATCLMAYTYQYLVDLYDQVPYTEALQGYIQNFAPHFDDGEVVYDGIIAEIDEALSKDFSASTVKENPNDFLIGSADAAGQVDFWTKFANTVKLRIYLRQVYARPGVANPGIADLLAENNFLDQDAAITAYLDELAKSNPLYEIDKRGLNTTDNLRGSQTLITFLLDNDDPRIDKWFDEGTTGHFGLVNGGQTLTAAQVPYGKPDIAYVDPLEPFQFFSYDETQFLVAEAHARMDEYGAAKAAYDEGVLAAFDRYGEDGSDFIDIGGAYEYPADGGDLETDGQLKAIITMKWLSVMYKGIEGYIEFNRTHFPEVSLVDWDDEVNYIPGTFTYSITGVTDGDFPKRLIFPQSERQRNPNTPAVIALTEKVWWDTK